MLNAAIWPALDYSRVPYRLYHDAEAYEREQERIFRGPTWHFLGLEAEIPNNGDFRATWVGDTPVIVNRNAGGRVHAFEPQRVICNMLASLQPPPINPAMTLLVVAIGVPQLRKGSEGEALHSSYETTTFASFRVINSAEDLCSRQNT